ASAFRGRDVIDGDVGAQGMGLRTQTPYMQVMHIFYPINGLQGNPYLRQRTTAGRTLEQDVERLAHNRQRAPQDQRGDEEREHGIDPVVTGQEDRYAAGDDRRGCKRVD